MRGVGGHSNPTPGEASWLIVYLIPGGYRMQFLKSEGSSNYVTCVVEEAFNIIYIYTVYIFISININ